ncbi:PH domain-containing protein [Paenibacillus sp. An7]|uniref:PH domain-containing protein n=1 Tax=Paenibacillus sp. An7 TaxID=2689577 RepID=UPI00135AECF2|nr:PH domain-containing protein [Paenibacillus sp. An7]
MNNINVEITVVGEYSTYEQLYAEAEKLPKTIRLQWIKALKIVKKNLNNEKIYFLSSAAFSGTTMGYLFVTDTKSILAEIRPFGKIRPHEIKYSDYSEIDHDILKALGMTASLIEFKKSGFLRSKKIRITHIPLNEFENIFKFIKRHYS